MIVDISWMGKAGLREEVLRDMTAFGYQINIEEYMLLPTSITSFR